MAPFTTYFIEPADGQSELILHLGRQGIGYEETAESCPSDSLFAALVAQAAGYEGLDPQTSDAPAFAHAFWEAAQARQVPPLRHSSLFPRIGSLVLLPRPMLELSIPDADRRQKIGKGFKKLRYLSPALFTAVCQGQPIQEMPLMLQQGKVWITAAEAARLPAPWAKTAGESPQQWQARLAATPIWAIQAVPHVTIDRVQNASNFYEVGQVVFATGCGLALLVQYHDTAIQRTFELLLQLLGESGIGGKRSSGYGAFTLKIQPDVRLLEPLTSHANAPRVVILSRYLPHREEMPAMLQDGAAYTLVNVGGWLLSPGAMAQQRQQITLVQEGAVLVASASSLIGTIADVRPDYARSNTPHPRYGTAYGTRHPVYRSGLALTVPVTAHF